MHALATKHYTVLCQVRPRRLGSPWLQVPLGAVTVGTAFARCLQLRAARLEDTGVVQRRLVRHRAALVLPHPELFGHAVVIAKAARGRQALAGAADEKPCHQAQPLEDHCAQRGLLG